MSKDKLPRNHLIDNLNPFYNRMRAKKLGLKKYKNDRPCKNGHLSERNVSTGQCCQCLNELYLKNKDVFFEKAKKWGKDNPEKLKIIRRNSCTKRFARIRNAKGTYKNSDIESLLKKQKGKCQNCLISIKRQYHIDHINPLSKGGTNNIENIQLLCPTCNIKKSNKDPIFWAQENGRLL